MPGSADALLKEELSRFGSEPDGFFDRKDRDHYRQILDRIAKDADRRAKGCDMAAERAAALADTLAGRWLFCAEEEGQEEPDRATLMHLLDQRCGASIVLGILWIVVGRRLGWLYRFPIAF